MHARIESLEPDTETITTTYEKKIYIYTHICALKFKGSVKLSPPVFYMSCFFVDSDHSFLKVHVLYTYIWSATWSVYPAELRGGAHVLGGWGGSVAGLALVRRTQPPVMVRMFPPGKDGSGDRHSHGSWGLSIMGPGFPNCQRTKGSGDRHRSLKTTVFVVCWRRIWLKMFLLWWCGHETGKLHERTRNRREILRKKQNHLRTNGVLWKSRVLVWILLDHFQTSWFGSYLKCSPCFQIESHNRIALEQVLGWQIRRNL